MVQDMQKYIGADYLWSLLGVAWVYLGGSLEFWYRKDVYFELGLWDRVG